jgi:hypothetical protein
MSKINSECEKLPKLGYEMQLLALDENELPLWEISEKLCANEA